MPRRSPLVAVFVLLAICRGGAGQNLLRNSDFARWDAEAPRPDAWGSWAHDLAEGEMARDQQAICTTRR